MFGRIPQVALLVGSLVLSGQAAAHGHGSDNAVMGAVVGAVVGGVFVASQRPPERVYVQAAPPPVTYYPAQPAYYPPPPPVYYQPVPVYYQAYPVVRMPPPHYGPPPGYYYGPPRPRW
ncbi:MULTISPECIES: hypothetical protein [Pseudomonas]|uniref:PXPV repeat-containing protein n=1 Tax=Pseudomonas kuykendallii TaxID=1007099 RepID=A0A2W5D7V7_9PSED|nr:MULTISPECIES: hypothetical protein [Pseudomonas]MCQ4269775.1 hypothetical protein [Pseudomonas kuykendallii]PZP26588.1 MAG: hypothetical protein DI599_00060 [Pseudomonas kuykendallii]SDX45959.1 hypothetical protein SAMN05216287_2988 [Pseudomonas kuykendallii]